MRRTFTVGMPVAWLTQALWEAGQTRDFLFVDLHGTALAPETGLLTRIEQEAGGDHTMRSVTGSPYEVFARGATLEDALRAFVTRCQDYCERPSLVPN